MMTPEKIVEAVFQYGMTKGNLKLLIEEMVEDMRKPNPSDAEVWRCPCCDQMVDRHIMVLAKQNTIVK